MSLAGLGPKSGSRYVCLIIAETGQQGLMLYKGDTGVNVAARQPEDGPTEVGSLLASSLPLLDNACNRQSQLQINAVGLDFERHETYKLKNYFEVRLKFLFWYVVKLHRCVLLMSSNEYFNRQNTVLLAEKSRAISQ